MFDVKNNRSQILAITIFIMVTVLFFGFIFLIPLNQQIIQVGKLLNVFQALVYAESGIEIGNYYGIKGSLILSGLNAYESQNFSYFNNTPCQYFSVKLNLGPFNECYVRKYKNDFLNIELYNSIERDRINDIIKKSYLKNISLGSNKNIQRVLDFDFW